MRKEKAIIFYGDNYTPLSNECYGCHNYGYLCLGSVHETECRAGIVENEKPSFIASLILRHCNNQFILARCFGYDIKSLVNPDDLKSKELKEKYKEALNTSEEVIQNYRNMFSLDLYDSVQVFEESDFTPIQKSEPIATDPFKDVKVIAVDEDDLPF